jgi:hypothetical protein
MLYISIAQAVLPHLLLHIFMDIKVAVINLEL